MDDAFTSKVVNQRDGRSDNKISFFGMACVNVAAFCREGLPHSDFNLFIVVSTPEALSMSLYC